jgi:uncharacterized protein YcbK (DUF882 family)
MGLPIEKLPTMNTLKRIVKWILFTVLTILALSIAAFFLYCNSLDRVNPKTVGYYEQLKAQLKAQGHTDKLLVISSKRADWHNSILTLFGASSQSKHLSGDAVDIMVMDVNFDGKIDSMDVDIVYAILDQRIVKNKGGLGTYKSEVWIWNRQMVHLDCREKRTRWHR